MKIEELKAKLAKVEDPRRTGRGNVRHKLGDIIMIGLCALICSGNRSNKAYHVVSAFVAENQLHWRLDVIFHEDASQARKDLSSFNLIVDCFAENGVGPLQRH